MVAAIQPVASNIFKNARIESPMIRITSKNTYSGGCNDPGRDYSYGNSRNMRGNQQKQLRQMGGDRRAADTDAQSQSQRESNRSTTVDGAISSCLSMLWETQSYYNKYYVGPSWWGNFRTRGTYYRFCYTTRVSITFFVVWTRGAHHHTNVCLISQELWRNIEPVLICTIIVCEVRRAESEVSWLTRA